MSVAGVLLAAGQSTRMGVPKVLLPIRGRPMIRIVADCLFEAGLEELIVVAQPGHSDIEEALHGLELRWTAPAASPIGMGHSIAAGVAASSANVDALLIALADMPDVLPATVKAMISLASASRIVVPRYQQQSGHPVLFGADLRSELMQLSGDEGARRILQAHPDRIDWLEVNDPGTLRDYDTPEDLE